MGEMLSVSPSTLHSTHQVSMTRQPDHAQEPTFLFAHPPDLFGGTLTLFQLYDMLCALNLG